MAVRCLVKMKMMKMLVCVCVVLAGVVSRSAGVQGQMEEGSVNATVPGGIDELPEETQRDIDRFERDLSALLNAVNIVRGTEDTDEIVADSEVDATAALCSTSTCCFMEESNCDMNAVEALGIESALVSPRRDAGSVLVFPGGETRCIFSYSSAFAFQVWPGSRDNVLVYFQGGGACWDDMSTDFFTACTTDAAPNGQTGIFSRTDPRNPFREYTILHILYCSGDVHIGHVTRPYVDEKGVPVQQNGALNVESVLAWAVNEQEAGRLAPSLSNLVVMGCSAGSLGAQLWSSTILNRLAFQNAAVYADSFVGVFPAGSESELIRDFGACEFFQTNGMTPEFIVDACFGVELTVTQIISEYSAQVGEMGAPFVFLQSKVDVVQLAFYDLVGLTTTPNLSIRNLGDSLITPSSFYREANTMLSNYTSPNVLVYLVDGGQHCFTPFRYFYSADTYGKDTWAAQLYPNITDASPGDVILSSSVSVLNWTTGLPLEPGESLRSQCSGVVKEEDAWRGTTYCAPYVIEQTYTA